jgi:hypothetical protein
MGFPKENIPRQTRLAGFRQRLPEIRRRPIGGVSGFRRRRGITPKNL